MDSQGIFILVIALVAVASEGWGALTVALLTRSRALADHPVVLDPVLNICIGYALFLAIGGMFVAADLASFPFLISWQIIGAGLSIFSIIMRRAWRDWRPLAAFPSLIALFSALGCAFLSLGGALSGAWNLNDDGPAYTYLGQRLLATGGLIDPFNARRLNSYGGAELLFGYLTKLVGPAANLGVEWFLFLLLVLALVVRTLRRRSAIFIVLSVGVALVVFHPMNGFANSAPTFSGVALMLGLALVLGAHRHGERTGWLYLLAGLLFAGLFALRLEFTFGAVALIFVSAMTSSGLREGVIRILWAVLGAIVGLAGWAIALNRSSGTPLFPLFPGNWTEQSWVTNPLIRTLSERTHEVVLILETDHLDLALVGALALSGAVRVVIARRRARGLAVIRSDLDLVIALGIGTLALVISQAVANPGSTLSDIGRYCAPTALAMILFAIAKGWELIDQLYLHEQGPVRHYMQGLRITGGALCSIGLMWMIIGVGPTSIANTLTADASQATKVVTLKPVLFDSWSWGWQRAQERFYNKINARVPRGSYLLSAVTLPGELDLSKFRITTLDEPGGTSPPPGFNLTASPNTVVRYLSSLGINGIVADTGKALGLYNLATAQYQLNSYVPYYRAQSHTTIEWLNLLGELEARYETYRVGQLRYLSFDRPRPHPIAFSPIPLTS